MSEYRLSDGTPHREPVLTSVPCSEDRMPANCAKAARLAQQHGWGWRATYAIGFLVGKTDDGMEVHSVAFRAVRLDRQIAALWLSKPGTEKLEFGGCWLKVPGDLALRLTSGEMFAELATEPIAAL